MNILTLQLQPLTLCSFKFYFLLKTNLHLKLNKLRIQDFKNILNCLMSELIICLVYVHYRNLEIKGSEKALGWIIYIEHSTHSRKQKIPKANLLPSQHYYLPLV